MSPYEKAEELWLYYDQWPNLSQEDKKAACINVCAEVMSALWLIRDKTSDYAGGKAIKFWLEVETHINKQ